MGPRETQRALERAEDLLMRGRGDTAAGLFRLAIQAHPLCVRAHMGLSNCGAAAGQPPEIAARLLAAARQCDERGDARSAHSLRAKAIAVEPGNADHQLEHATRLVSDGRLEDAMTLLSYAAELLLANRRYDEARAVLMRVDRIDRAVHGSGKRTPQTPHTPHTPHGQYNEHRTMVGHPPPPHRPHRRSTNELFAR